MGKARFGDITNLHVSSKNKVKKCKTEKAKDKLEVSNRRSNEERLEQKQFEEEWEI